ncbi:LLM class flavin-dependent oxidoreductase [Gordonia defluvii]|uniref:LLM class flavin-dependent oxidoreductase n=1 Tax=Gordonia defluvii TaxID=283718 RepID=UPI0031CDF809
MSTDHSAPTAGVPLSILDLAHVGPDETVRASLAHSTRLAEFADTTAYRRIWYAEHHNMAAIASAAPAVLIAHMAAHTSRIRLGAGGVMLPNHSPLTIAEQYGTLAELHPGRIDLGLGRAPGGDQATFAALRRTHQAADDFPRDVLELQGYLRDASRVPGVRATPGAGTNIDLYILGSSLFGAQLAAALGLPYAFASHFAPHALGEAVALYRNEFQPAPLPSGRQSSPYVIAGVTAIAIADAELAADQFNAAKRQRIKHLLAHHRPITDDEADLLFDSPVGHQVSEMMRYAAIGTPDEVKVKLNAFAGHADADELVVASLAPDRDVWFDTLVNLAPARSSSDPA